MSNLNHYERLALEAIRAAATGAAVARFDDELVLRPSRSAIEEAHRNEDLTAERALFASTTTGQALLRRQGWSDAEIAALAARSKKPQVTTPEPVPAPQPAIIKAPAAAIAPPVAMPSSLTTDSVATPPAANTVEGWRAEFERSVELQAEFGTVERYVGYQTGVASGRIGSVRGGVVLRSPGVLSLIRPRNERAA